MLRWLAEEHAALVIFPELGISGYSIDDLLHQGALLDAVEGALQRVVSGSSSLSPVIAVGARSWGRPAYEAIGSRRPDRGSRPSQTAGAMPTAARTASTRASSSAASSGLCP